MKTESELDKESDDASWRLVADCYPHEAHARDPERFWAYFQTKRPGMTREQMERLLKETA